MCHEGVTEGKVKGTQRLGLKVAPLAVTAVHYGCELEDQREWKGASQTFTPVTSKVAEKWTPQRLACSGLSEVSALGCWLRGF